MSEQDRIAELEAEVKRLHDKYDFQLLVKEREELRAICRMYVRALSLIRDYNQALTPQRIACLTPEENMRIIAREALAGERKV